MPRVLEISDRDGGRCSEPVGGTELFRIQHWSLAVRPASCSNRVLDAVGVSGLGKPETEPQASAKAWYDRPGKEHPVVVSAQAAATHGAGYVRL